MIIAGAQTPEDRLLEREEEHQHARRANALRQLLTRSDDIARYLRSCLARGEFRVRPGEFAALAGISPSQAGRRLRDGRRSLARAFAAMAEADLSRFERREALRDATNRRVKSRPKRP